MWQLVQEQKDLGFFSSFWFSEDLQLVQLVAAQLLSSCMGMPPRRPKHTTWSLLQARQRTVLCLPRHQCLSHELSQGLFLPMVMTVTLKLWFCKAYIKHLSTVLCAKQIGIIYISSSQKSQTAPNVPVSSSVAKKEWNNNRRSLAQFLDLAVASFVTWGNL